MVIYPATFVQEDDGYYIYFQDLEGCQTEGEDLEKAILMAQEALGLYIVSLQEREINIPKATNLKDIKISNNEFVSLVSTDLEKFRRKNKAVKKTLTIPQWLNEIAEKNDINFSAVLQKGLKEELKIAE